MGNSSIMRRLLTLIMLTSVSMAGLFGPALHQLAHLGGHHDSDGCATTTSCSCTDCPFARLAKQQDSTPQTNEKVGEKHDCAICRFLAMSKQVDRHDVKPEQQSIAFEAVCVEYQFESLSTFALSTAPRGPPVSI